MAAETSEYHQLGLLTGLEEAGYYQMMMDFTVDMLKAYGHAAEMLPAHFLGKTFRANGGFAENVIAGNDWAGYNFHLPSRNPGEFVTRTHLIKIHPDFKLPTDWYDAKAEPEYDGKTLVSYTGFSIRLPSQKEAEKIPSLQRTVWGYGENEQAAIYPKDLYGRNRGAATRLVAVLDDGTVVGSQLGFWGHGKKWTGDHTGLEKDTDWLESQISSVHKDHQGKHIATKLKWQQADDAHKENINLIRWTVDPLLLGNAVVNFRHLGAIATEYKEAQYNFINAQNLVPASRFVITWLLDQDRTEKARAENLPKYEFTQLTIEPDTDVIYPVSSGFDTEGYHPQNKTYILINIPANWKEMQNEDRVEGNMGRSLKWRTSTDKLFGKLLGTGRGKYVITGVVKNPAGEPFLVAQPFERINEILAGSV